MFHGTLPGNRYLECYSDLYLQNENKQSKCFMAHPLATSIHNFTLVIFLQIKPKMKLLHTNSPTTTNPKMDILRINVER